MGHFPSKFRDDSLPLTWKIHFSRWFLSPNKTRGIENSGEEKLNHKDNCWFRGCHWFLMSYVQAICRGRLQAIFLSCQFLGDNMSLILVKRSSNYNLLSQTHDLLYQVLALKAIYIVYPHSRWHTHRCCGVCNNQWGNRIAAESSSSNGWTWCHRPERWGNTDCSETRGMNSPTED